MLTHQRIPCFPPKLPTQKLNHGLKVIRNGHSKEVLLHYRRVSNRFEAHDNYRKKGKKKGRAIDMVGRRCVCHGQFRDGRKWTDADAMYASEPFVGSFFL
jgi:hypothetical protein